MKMNARILARMACLLAAAHAGSAAAQATQFDGKWSVKLVCDDVKTDGAMAKGYTYFFDVTVVNGHLEGNHGQLGEPASVKYVGEIQQDGSVDIIANGRTGKPDRSIDAVDRGTAYNYQMRGKFDQSFGHATRLTLRPCEATFSKN
jgi:hypothetical protein